MGINNIFDEDNKEETTLDKVRNSLIFFTVGSFAMGLSIGMREGVYKNNYGDNWWGTVNGAFTLGLACELIGAGIPYVIYKLSDGKFDEINILWGALFGIAGGVTMAFFPPFKEAFRENTFLYYSFPGLFVSVSIVGIFDIWFGKKSHTPRRANSNALLQIYSRFV